MIADYDTISRELRDLHYDDGMPVPPDQIASIAAGAKILPAVFSADPAAHAVAAHRWPGAKILPAVFSADGDPRRPTACLIVFMASDDV